MDPLTHALIGIIIGSKAGGALSWNDGIMVATTLGAVMPDLDIAAQFWGDYNYLKQHRGFSHSLAGLFVTSVAVGAALGLLYPAIGITSLMMWTFLGALSHTLIDLFNSYGVNFAWPISKKKWTANLLMSFDPVLFMLGVAWIFVGKNGQYEANLALGAVCYLFIRYLMREHARRVVKRRLKRRYLAVKVVVMPSMSNIFKWDFIAELPERRIVGHIDLLKRNLRIAKRLHYLNKPLRQALTATVLGKVFSEFTPFFHIECELIDGKVVGHFMDLRYRVRDRFLHNGTLIFDDNMNVEEAIFQPFSLSRRNYLNIS